jgi:hypothetical protein
MDPPQPPEPKGLISTWDENDVHFFFSNLGFIQYEAKIKGQWLLFIVFLPVTVISSLPYCRA